MALGPVTETFDERRLPPDCPGPGTAQRKPGQAGTPVGLTVSKGPQPIPVPDVRGQEQGAAVKALGPPD